MTEASQSGNKPEDFRGSTSESGVAEALWGEQRSNLWWHASHAAVFEKDLSCHGHK